MNDDQFSIVDKQVVTDMLFGEEKYIVEFAEASIQSFEEFSTHYRKYVLERDLENLKKAGHKIKPVAQMLHLEQILVEYQNAKKLLENDRPDEELGKSVETIHQICEQVINDFKLMLKS